ncbi:MAG TPA: hypothetical protein VMZ31_09100 [Phycisphaerae bacterium]|nr:hypothetical protein [Phycisphaerae bacterium]
MGAPEQFTQDLKLPPESLSGATVPHRNWLGALEQDRWVLEEIPPKIRQPQLAEGGGKVFLAWTEAEDADADGPLRCAAVIGNTLGEVSGIPKGWLWGLAVSAAGEPYLLWSPPKREGATGRDCYLSVCKQGRWCSPVRVPLESRLLSERYRPMPMAVDSKANVHLCWYSGEGLYYAMVAFGATQ